MKYYILVFLLISILSFNSCDLLRFSQFEVVSWTPGDGFHYNPENISVSISFSNEPDRASIERNFSLTGNGNRVKGKYFWNGKRMTFSPLTPFEINTDYNVKLSADAYDDKGLSMDRVFSRDFSTRAAGERPVLISFYPELYARSDDPQMIVKLEFSAPVPLKTLYDNVSFSPSMTGLWRLEDDGKSAIFTPSEPWMNNSRYEIRLSSSLIDNNGMSIGNDFFSIFTTGADFEIPRLVNALRVTKAGERFLLEPCDGFAGVEKSFAENSGWEKDDRLLLEFSKPIDSNLTRNYISVNDGPNLKMETPAGFYSEIIFSFDSVPVYGSRFTFAVKPGIKDKHGNETNDEYIFRVHANGKHSIPPSLAGIRMPMAPDSYTDKQLKHYSINSLYESIPVSDEYYPSGENIKTWIELYFSAAEGAVIDLFSVMELFRIETSNNVINFSPRRVKGGNFTVPDPQCGWENLQRVEIEGIFVNSVFFGIINFRIASGLRDSLGNRNEKSFEISVIK